MATVKKPAAKKVVVKKAAAKKVVVKKATAKKAKSVKKVKPVHMFLGGMTGAILDAINAAIKPASDAAAASEGTSSKGAQGSAASVLSGSGEASPTTTKKQPTQAEIDQIKQAATRAALGLFGRRLKTGGTVTKRGGRSFRG